MAQDYPKEEILGGYSYLRSQGDNFNGWNASAAGNANDWFGIKADFSGYYKSGLKAHTFMFGPQFSFRKEERVTPFVHTLFGGTHVSDGGSDTAFSMALGGGIDVKAAEHVAVRVIQADYVMTRFDGETQNNLPLSFGIVFRF